MNAQRRELVSQARKMFKKIYPPPTKKHLSQCFTVDENRLCFWFNTEDQSTHLLTAETVAKPRRSRKRLGV